MGWIKAGNIEVFSFADSISRVTSLIFDFITVLFNPFVMFIFAIFIIVFVILVFSIIKEKIRLSGIDG